MLLLRIQCDMQKLTVDELKSLLYDTFCDHLTMKDIENIIMTEESHLNSPECQVDIDSTVPWYNQWSISQEPGEPDPDSTCDWFALDDLSVKVKGVLLLHASPLIGW